jgi:hypothetical protein
MADFKMHRVTKEFALTCQSDRTSQRTMGKHQNQDRSQGETESQRLWDKLSPITGNGYFALGEQVELEINAEAIKDGGKHSESMRSRPAPGQQWSPKFRGRHCKAEQII